MNLLDFIKVYDNALDVNTCQQIINIFDGANENSLQFFEKNGYPNFVRLNTNSIAENQKYKHIFEKIKTSLEEYKNKYITSIKSKVKEEKHIIGFSDHGYEALMIKKYNNNNLDRFDVHVDNFNKQTSNRFLVMLYYLNDVEHGGHTEFPTLNIKISPSVGRLLIFPPNFLFPHAGLKPISGPKYILTTYLNYNN